MILCSLSSYHFPLYFQTLHFLYSSIYWSCDCFALSMPILEHSSPLVILFRLEIYQRRWKWHICIFFFSSNFSILFWHEFLSKEKNISYSFLVYPVSRLSFSKGLINERFTSFTLSKKFISFQSLRRYGHVLKVIHCFGLNFTTLKDST